jgi:hypothetical protein
MHLSTELFPVPLGPDSASTSPGAIAKERSLKPRMFFPPRWCSLKYLLKFSTHKRLIVLLPMRDRFAHSTYKAELTNNWV